MKLELGNRSKRDGWTTLDHAGSPDVVCDLSEGRLPFADCSVEAIEAYNLFEHLPNWLDIVRECHRVLARGGTMTVTVPHCQGLYANCLDHCVYFSRQRFDGLVCQSCMTRPMFEEVYYQVQVFGFRNTFLDVFASCLPRAWEKFSPVKPDMIYWKGRKI